MVAGSVSGDVGHVVDVVASPLEIKREVLKIAFRNSHNSVFLLVVVSFLVGALAWRFTGFFLALTSTSIGLASAYWRFAISNSLGEPDEWSEARANKLIFQAELNAALTGSMWALVTLVSFSRFPDPANTIYFVMILGSLAVSGTFMSLIGRSLTILTAFELGSLIVEKVLKPETGDWMFLCLFPVYGIVVVQSGLVFKKTALLAIHNGLTARASEKASRQLQEEAERANEAKSAFLAMMSHELRTPLFGITASTTQLLDRPHGELERSMLMTVDQSAAHLLKMLNQCLTVVQLGGTKLPIDLRSINGGALIKDTVDAHQAVAATKKIKLTCNLHWLSAIWMFTDPERLRQILFNLVGNALKFTVSGAVTVDVYVIDEYRLRLTVTDTGPGMAPSALSHIFEPFNKGAAVNAWERQRGLGLGLSITRGVCDALGGTVSATSELGVGTVFEVILPLQSVKQEQNDDAHLAAAALTSAASTLAPLLAVDNTPETPMERSSWPGMIQDGVDLALLKEHALAESNEPLHVLVIDDAEINRLVVGRVLTQAGHEITFAASAVSGLLELAIKRYNVVLVDLEMPVLNGIRMVEEYRRIAPGLPEPAWIIATGHHIEQARLAAKAIKAADFMGKPIDLERLRTGVRRAAATVAITTGPPTLDRGFLHSHSLEMPDFVQRYLKLWRKAVTEHLDRLDAALAVGDTAEAQHVVHQFGGIAGTMGDSGTLSIARELSAKIAAIGEFLTGEEVREKTTVLVQRLREATVIGIDSLELYAAARELEHGKGTTP